MPLHRHLRALPTYGGWGGRLREDELRVKLELERESCIGTDGDDVRDGRDTSGGGGNDGNDGGSGGSGDASPDPPLGAMLATQHRIFLNQR